MNVSRGATALGIVCDPLATRSCACQVRHAAIACTQSLARSHSIVLACDDHSVVRQRPLTCSLPSLKFGAKYGNEALPTHAIFRGLRTPSQWPNSLYLPRSSGRRVDLLYN